MEPSPAASWWGRERVHDHAGAINTRVLLAPSRGSARDQGDVSGARCPAMRDHQTPDRAQGQPFRFCYPGAEGGYARPPGATLETPFPGELYGTLQHDWQLFQVNIPDQIRKSVRYVHQKVNQYVLNELRRNNYDPDMIRE